MEILGVRLHLLREAMDMTQAELAERIAVPRETYATWEAGRFNPSFDDLIKLARLFEVSTDDLLGQTDYPRPVPPQPAPGEALGQWLRQAMERKHLTLIEVSRMARVPLNVLSEVQEGRSGFILLPHLRRLAKFFDVSLEDLVALLPTPAGPGVSANPFRFGTTTEDDLRDLGVILRKMFEEKEGGGP